jgi:hypothetical protein
MLCRHFKDGMCAVESRCGGDCAKCEFTSSDIDENPGIYRFLLAKSMELLNELSEHKTCSLPCSFCKKCNMEPVCDGKFEWIYAERINRILNGDD